MVYVPGLGGSASRKKGSNKEEKVSIRYEATLKKKTTKLRIPKFVKLSS